MAIHCKQESLPLTFAFVDAFGQRYGITRAWTNKEDIDVDELVELKENMDIDFHYRWDLLEQMDEQSSIVIEVTKEEESEWSFSLSNQEERRSLYQRGDEYPWRMGYYLITFTYQFKTYYTGFAVHPLHLQPGQLKQMHAYLETKVTGLIKDALNQHQLYSPVRRNWYHQYAKLIEEHSQEITYFFQLLSKKSITSLVGMHEVSTRPGRMNQKSIQWQLQQKSNEQVTYLNKVKKEVIDTPENRWMKTILTSWLREIDEVEKYLLHDGDEKAYEAVYSLKHKVIYMLYKSFLAQVPLGNKKPLLKRTAYHKINTYYEQLKAVYSQRETIHIQRGDTFKKTWKLYEYYCLFIILDVFQSKGYVLRDGLSPETLHYYQREGIVEGSCFHLEGPKNSIKIWYDKELPSCYNQAMTRNEDVYHLGANKRPDIRIDFYDKNGQYQSTTVLDGKFRKLDNIRTQGMMTSTQLQLMSYWQIVPTKGMRPSVEQVICLYPNDGFDHVLEYDQSITYIKLFPHQDTDATIGLKELMKVL